MKKHFISIIAVVVALAVTVCILGVGSVSAMKGRKPSAPVIGFTGGYEVTYPEGHGVTYPTTDPICVDYTSYFIIPANSNMAELLNGRSDEIYNGNPDHSITFAAVPASDKVYEFYIEERFFGSSWGVYGDSNGMNLAFTVTSDCDVTITETSYHKFAVTGSGVQAVASSTPVGEYAGDVTQPYTSYTESNEETYPTTEPVCADYTSYFIIPANDNMAQLTNNSSPEIYTGDPNAKVVLKNVPASDKVYEFYVEERFFNQTYGTYGTAMGNNFAFKVTEECDVTIFEATHHSFVIVGDGVVIMASNNPIGQTEFGTEPQYTTVAPLTYPEGSSYYEITYPEGDYISTTGNAPVYQMGDVNRDGRVDVVDATLVQRYAAGLEELDPEQLKLAEVCGLKPVTVVNATQIQKYAAGFNVTL